MYESLMWKFLLSVCDIVSVPKLLGTSFVFYVINLHSNCRSCRVFRHNKV